MKLKISLTTSIRTQDSLGLNETPMLLLCKLAGHGLGSHIQTLDQAVGGLISSEVDKTNFRGNRGEYFVLDIDQEDAPQSVMLVGLGTQDKFDSGAIVQLVELAVEEAVKRGCSKVSVPILPNRQAQGINLRGQAHLIKVTAERKVASLRVDEGELEIELVCAPQAKAHLQKGLSCKRMGSDGRCCDETAEGGSKSGQTRKRVLSVSSGSSK